MKFTRVLLHVFLFGFVLCLVKGQDLTVSVDDGGEGEGEEVEEEVEALEDDEDSAMSRLLNVTTVEDFMALLTIDGRPVRNEDLFSQYDSDDDKQHITIGGGRMAEPDDCSPRDTTVRLPLDFSDPQVVFYPRCTKVKRCGGCCSSPYLECVPAYTERESLKVVKAQVPFPGSSHLTYTGFTPVIVDVHVTCRVECSLTPEKCGPKKRFISSQCDCKCREYQRCQPPHVWDPEECACSCAERQNCCKNGDVCGLAWNPVTCECDVASGVQYISNTNITQEEMDAYLAELNGTAGSAQVAAASPTTSTTTATTTTTTTTTATTEPQEQCPNINCPPGFTKHQNFQGVCACRPNMRFSRTRHRLSGRGR